MSGISQRAQKILAILRTQTNEEFFIRQVTLADQLGCSRRSIGRALKELKDSGVLFDLQKRHDNRCKIYKMAAEMTRPAQHQWDLYQKTFSIVFKEPDLKERYKAVTWHLRHVKEEMELWSNTWAGLYGMRGAQLPG